jgi:1-deoxy-D-xylulose-5-phosphate synthase
VVGPPIYDTLHGMKKGLKDIVAPQGMFEDLGLKYVGPVDGHDVLAVERALRRAREFGGPVIVHVITQKGHGYPPAENDEADQFHGVGVIDPETGFPVSASGPTWLSVFGREMLLAAQERPDVVGITAAMLKPVGLDLFAQAYPTRVFDVGIAEQHATTSAAGMALGGLHPVVAVYATFLNRAFDQVLMDCALHRAGVTFVLTHGGVTGEDGSSHHGMWDMSFLRVVPGLRLAAPRDGATLRLAFREALDVGDAPTVVRFPKGALPADVPKVDEVDGLDVLRRSGDEDVLLVSVGAMAGLCLEVAAGLEAQGIGVTVVDPRWVHPLPSALAALAARHDLVVSVEDNGRTGGIGDGLAQLLRDAGVPVPLRDFGIPQQFLPQGRRDEVLAEVGLTAQKITRAVVEATARLDHSRETDPTRDHADVVGLSERDHPRRPPPLS